MRGHRWCVPGSGLDVLDCWQQQARAVDPVVNSGAPGCMSKVAMRSTRLTFVVT